MLWFVNYQDNYYICKKKTWNIILNPISKFLLQLLYPTKKRSFFWKCDLYSHKKGNLFICIGSMSYKCIPYEGNEHLVGKELEQKGAKNFAPFY